MIIDIFFYADMYLLIYIYYIYIFMNDLSCFYVIRRILLNHESCKSGSIKIIPC